MKPKLLNLSDQLQYKQRHRRRKSFYWLGGTFLLILVIASFLSLGLPWHWQLFLHWLFRQGHVTEIPVHLHPEIRELCRQSNPNGQVNGYQASSEIAYGLGRFDCRSSGFLESWIISDRYGFDQISESAAGTQLAEVLVAIVGTDYFYQIRGTVPLKK